jgi:hypothetical protein
VVAFVLLAPQPVSCGIQRMRATRKRESEFRF